MVISRTFIGATLIGSGQEPGMYDVVMSSVAKRSRDISIFANHRRFFRSGACLERSRIGREISGLASPMETPRPIRLRSLHVSNRWKKKKFVFQSLEDLRPFFPIVGKNFSGFSNRWKPGMAKGRAYTTKNCRVESDGRLLQATPFPSLPLVEPDMQISRIRLSCEHFVIGAEVRACVDIGNDSSR